MVNKLTNPPTQKDTIDKINEIIDNFPSGTTVDQTFDATSTNAQSGVAINGELTSNYQPKLVSGTNIKTINNTSLLGSGNIAVLQNTASNGGLTLLGTSTNSSSINIGNSSSAIGASCVALGNSSTSGYGNTPNCVSVGASSYTNGKYSTAVGCNAQTSAAEGAIQLGYGMNTTANTLSVGFNGGNLNKNWQLLDGSTGLIPDARISTNIARSSDVADTTLSNVSSIDSNSAVATALDGKADTDLSNLSATGKTVIDGQWTTAYQDIISSDTSVNGSTDLTKRVAVPNDGYVYEAMIMTRATTTATSGQLLRVAIGTNQLDQDVLVCGLRTRTNSTMEVQATNIVPIKGVATNSTNLTIARGSGINGNINVMRLIAYRRVGTNS